MKHLKPINIKTSRARKALSDTSFQNIRITFDYRFVDGELDTKLKCTKSDQVIKLNDESVYCTAYDILTKNKIDILKETLENVKSYFNKLIYVEPTMEEFEIKSQDQYFHYPEKQVAKNTDLYVTVIAISLGRDSISPAMGAAIVFDEFTQRPLQGLLLIDTKSIPDILEGQNTIPKYAFMSYVHEFIHILGFGGRLIEKFHPIGNYDPYPANESICHYTKHGVDFVVLTTPYAHIFAKNHYGVDEFVGDNGEKCKSGIHLETGGDSDFITLQHLEGRLFVDDIMVSINLGLRERENDIPVLSDSFQRVTDATLAVLLDTGNYKVNYTMASPLVWGNPESIDGKPIKDFADGPPQSVLPSHYSIGLFNNDDSTLFNYKGAGLAVLHPVGEAKCDDEAQMDKRFCRAKNFYNPAEYEYYGGSDIFDYIMMVRPVVMCPPDLVAIPGAHECYLYSCDGYNSVTFHVKLPNGSAEQLTCRSDKDEPLNFTKSDGTNVSVKCVNPEIFCRTIRLTEMKFKKNPFIDGVIHLDEKDQGKGPDIYPDFKDTRSTDDPENQEDDPSFFKKHQKYFIIGFIALGIIIVVTIIVIILVHRRSHLESSSAGLNDLQED
ncbi:GP63-like [Trichomonas vaginalis G3]|uniref:GP63-like n=1 Tax=Trichomonas vaginalis (strain ATCC PRA-98 / G3) TaxID=412133 RepID=A2DKD2_TRIV3|nr:regulation of choline O-acetyltransferase protein [Trichomonas vaginalis G3]EAY19109.1 GP63-like [Trichomonas vaginalis G3]KAI5490407.1 regulation of choline O-acetyltransferase protein [Trichomonas vaginalis G3]|eukprot:XP_001580095.1 GP63-like [Trichomonas vaginalis G3]